MYLVEIEKIHNHCIHLTAKAFRWFLGFAVFWEVNWETKICHVTIAVGDAWSLGVNMKYFKNN